MQPNHTRKNAVEEYSELVMRSMRDEAQQLLRQWAAEAQQRRQSFMGLGAAGSGRFTLLGNGASRVSRTVEAEDPTAVVWFGADHRGYIQGPVSLNLLSIWFRLGYLSPNFRVWKIGQYEWQSVLLLHLLNN